MHSLSSSSAESGLLAEKFHESGVNGFFRIMSANLHQQNGLADRKANIMISINTVVLSLLIGSMARNIEYWQNLLLPITFLVSTSLTTTVIAVLATRPRLIRGHVSKESIQNRTAQLLFFGNFTTLSLEEYEETMMTVLKDDDYLYRSVLRDFYAQGVILNRKYRLLHISYNVFLIGMITSVVTFGVWLWVSKI
ncbi:Pycsar system effector family protein [Larkinella sp.]|uniref:Pycsar system effector family protein n=1 Tax=Larkinella sp. TaxID=2034517 RepID=UPI003BAB51F7